MAVSKVICIDSTAGGNGDIWMRLVSFYAVANLLPQQSMTIYVPGFFYNLAVHAFGDRLNISSQKEKTSNCLTYTNRGIKDLIGPILNGKKFISPYQQAVISDKKEKKLKDFLNTFIFYLTDLAGLVQVPDKKWIKGYQGFLDLIGIKSFRPISYNAYIDQLKNDYDLIRQRLQNHLPISDELVVPEDLHENVLIYPTGTSRQFVPVWWAIKFMPKAYYAFFVKDPEAKEFQAAGLKVIFFYKEPGDIIYLSHHSKWTITTDSFPSHLLQSATEKCTVVLTEVLKSRIISPVFKGIVADSLAPCHPCLHMARKTHPLCAAGYSECLNWKIDQYTNNILTSYDKFN